MSIYSADIEILRGLGDSFFKDAMAMCKIKEDLDAKVKDIYETWKNFGKGEFTTTYETYTNSYNEFASGVSGMGLTLRNVAQELENANASVSKMARS